MKIGTKTKKVQMKNVYDGISNEYELIFDSGQLRLLRQINLYILDTILGGSECKTILDGGGATGFLTVPLAEQGHHVTVVDISEGMIKRGKMQNKTNCGRINYKVADLENLSDFEDSSFDFILLEGGVLSYLSNPELGLSEVYRLLKPGGKTLLTGQNKYHFMGLIPSINISKFIFHRSKVPSNLNDVNIVTNCFTPEDFRLLLSKSGLKVEKLGSKLITIEKMPYLNDDLLEKDKKCFKEVLELEKRLLWKSSLAGVGRTLMALCTKFEKEETKNG